MARILSRLSTRMRWGREARLERNVEINAEVAEKELIQRNAEEGRKRGLDCGDRSNGIGRSGAFFEYNREAIQTRLLKKAAMLCGHRRL